MGFWRRDDGRDCGAFDVVLEREELAPGDTLAGVVLFQVFTPIADAVLTVDVRGRECVEQKDNVEGETETSEHSLWFHAIARRQLALTTDGLDIPFAIELPTDLPHTSQFDFGTRRGLQTKLSVTYEIVCSLHVPDHTKLDLARSVPFTVTALPIARRVGQHLQKSKNREFRHSLLLKKSLVEVRVRLDSDVFTVDTLISAYVKIKLDELERVQSISMVLNRRIVPNPSDPSVVPSECKQVASTRNEKPELRGADSTQSLSLRIPPTMLSEVGPLKPTLAFYHFVVAYEVVVTCDVKSCAPIRIQFPVTILPLATRSPPGQLMFP